MSLIAAASASLHFGQTLVLMPMLLSGFLSKGSSICKCKNVYEKVKREKLGRKLNDITFSFEESFLTNSRSQFESTFLHCIRDQKTVKDLFLTDLNLVMV